MNPGLTKTYTAQGAIGSRRIVKFGTADLAVAIAAAAANLQIGVTAPNIDVADGDRVDVVRGGLAEVVYGDVVTRGQFLTSDAAGAAVPCAPAAGALAQSIGKAEFSGVAGDFGLVMVAPVQITTPAA
jgi:hypothetical protein